MLPDALFAEITPVGTQRRAGRSGLVGHGGLHPDVSLTGRYDRKLAPVDLEGVMREIDDARAAEAARLLRLQELE